MKMEESKTINTGSETKAEETKKSEKPAKSDEKKGFSFSNWFNAHKAEFKRIEWPTRHEVAKETVIVLVMCFFLGALIFGMDTVLNYGYDALIKLVANA
jgi:preprotein translocase SecE subunit